MHIHHLSVTDDYFRHEKSVEDIATMLLDGDRVMVEPLGEVFLIKQEDGNPQIEFVFENSFIVGVIEEQIKRLRDRQEKLGDPAKEDVRVAVETAIDDQRTEGEANENC